MKVTTPANAAPLSGPAAWGAATTAEDLDRALEEITAATGQLDEERKALVKGSAAVVLSGADLSDHAKAIALVGEKVAIMQATFNELLTRRDAARVRERMEVLKAGHAEAKEVAKALGAAWEKLAKTLLSVKDEAGAILELQNKVSNLTWAAQVEGLREYTVSLDMVRQVAAKSIPRAIPGGYGHDITSYDDNITVAAHLAIETLLLVAIGQKEFQRYAKTFRRGGMLDHRLTTTLAPQPESAMRQLPQASLPDPSISFDGEP